MAGKISAFGMKGAGGNNKRPGIHAKTKASTNPNSKNYQKPYRRQGK
jgi:hypothetical protein